MMKRMIVQVAEDGLEGGKMIGGLEEIVADVTDDDILYIFYYNG